MRVAVSRVLLQSRNPRHLHGRVQNAFAQRSNRFHAMSSQYFREPQVRRLTESQPILWRTGRSVGRSGVISLEAGADGFFQRVVFLCSGQIQGFL